MSKALVINGANFSANKVETITIGEAVPCTGLELSESTVSFSSIGETKTLTATKNPSNTTDVLTWESSDETVVTVADGVITCVGLGSATITATCGQQTDTCSVSVESITVNANTEYTGYNGYQLTSTDLTANPPKNYGGLYTYYKSRVYASGTPTESEHKAFSAAESYTGIKDSYPIAVPKNTKTIEVLCPSDFTGQGQMFAYDSTQEQTYLTGQYLGKPAALVKQYTWGVSSVSAGTQRKYTFTITEEGCDSIAIQITAADDASQVTGDVTFTFKPAAN